MKHVFLSIPAFSIPTLGEDPKGPGLFIIMGLCVVVMVAVLVFGKKKSDHGEK